MDILICTSTPSWNRHGTSLAILEQFWSDLGPSWPNLPILGLSWSNFGASWGHLCVSWGLLGSVLAYSGAILTILGDLMPSWGYLGAILGYLGPSWAILGASWDQERFRNPRPKITVPRLRHVTILELILGPFFDSFWVNFNFHLINYFSYLEK